MLCRYHTREAYSKIGLTMALYAVVLTEEEHGKGVQCKYFSEQDALAARCFTPLSLELMNHVDILIFEYYYIDNSWYEFCIYIL